MPKVRVKSEDEKAELRWKLWLYEKAILMVVVLAVGEFVGTVRSEA